MSSSAALRGHRLDAWPHPHFTGAERDTESLRELSVAALDYPRTATTARLLRHLDRPPIGVRWDDSWTALRDKVAALRRETLADLDSRLARLTAAAESNGIVVHRAADAEAACRIITGIARDHQVSLAIKSKSMVSEEIHLNAALAQAGVQVVETDLGEYIVQLAGERPSQLLGPATHLSSADIAEIFSTLGEQVPDDLQAMVGFARRRLRADFRAAELGISGVNFAAADTGTLAIVSNEGNVDMVTSQPRIHVALMGMEKVIARETDLAEAIDLLCYAAGEGRITNYQTMVRGPAGPGESGPEQVHLVMLDNGRSGLLASRYRDVLACIRCGNCQMSCPVFKVLGGGHAYGSVYGGPIGAVLSPFLGETAARDADLPFLSTLCGACGDACPVRIPLPDFLVELRADYQRRQHGVAAGLERAGWTAWSTLWRNRAGYALSTRAAALAGRLLPNPVLARLPLVRNWASGRAIPALRPGVRLPLSVKQRAGRSSGGDAGRVPDSGSRTVPAAPLPTSSEPAVPGPADPGSAEALVAAFRAACRDSQVELHPVADLPSAQRLIESLTGDRPALLDQHPELDALAVRRAQDPWDAEVGISRVQLACAATASMAQCWSAQTHRETGLLVTQHIVLLHATALIADYATFWKRVLAEETIGSGLRLVSGPSRSGDIELRTVYGVHGPTKLSVVLITDSMERA